MAFGEIQRVSSERALHLARSGSQSQRAIWFMLSTRGASHISRLDIGLFLFLRVCGPRLRLGPRTCKKELGQYQTILTENPYLT